MLFTFADVGTSAHAGFVAGRYRDGSWSDGWTDVRRCADSTFTAYAGACTCGWQTQAWPVGDAGWMMCRRLWHGHHAAAAAVGLGAHLL